MLLQLPQYGVQLDLAAARIEGSKRLGCRLVDVKPSFREVAQHCGTTFASLEACLGKIQKELSDGCRFRRKLQSGKAAIREPMRSDGFRAAAPPDPVVAARPRMLPRRQPEPVAVSAPSPRPMMNSVRNKPKTAS